VRTPRPWALPTQPVTRALLLASGVTDAMISTQVARGRLVHVRRGVFVGVDGWPDDAAGQHLVRAHAEQVANPDAVISHESAAVVWGLPTPGFGEWYQAPVSLTLPSTCHGTRRTSAAWHIAELPAPHVTRDDDGYLVTSLARTAVDLAAGLAFPQALVILDAAGRQVLASFTTSPRRSDYVNPRLVKAVRDALSDTLSRRWRAQLRAAIACVEPCRESAAESLTAGHLHLSGLPVPQFQAKIVTSKGIYYPDCYWPESRLIGECDGAGKYQMPDAIVREKEREQVLRDDGHRFVRWLGKEIMLSPPVVMNRIGAALNS